MTQTLTRSLTPSLTLTLASPPLPTPPPPLTFHPHASPPSNALQAMGEAIPALGWVMVEKTPGPHVADR